MTNDEEDPEEVLKQKEAIVWFLIVHQDEIIDRELRQYEGAAFYIRLQSECFNLYPLLARIIDNRRRRLSSKELSTAEIFTSLPGVSLSHPRRWVRCLFPRFMRLKIVCRRSLMQP